MGRRASSLTEHRYGGAKWTSTTFQGLYLEAVFPSGICFLEEVFYWVAFQRYPRRMFDPHGFDFRQLPIPGYEANFILPRLLETEWKRVGLPEDPRAHFDWAFSVKPDDTLETITDHAIEAAKKERPQIEVQEAQDGAIKLHKELQIWLPHYRNALELPAAKVYVALKEGKLKASGVQLSESDLKKALGTGSSDLDLSGAQDSVIPREFWSLTGISWERSVAHNQHQHYCQIHCTTEDVLSLFPVETLVEGRLLAAEVEIFGSIFRLKDVPIPYPSPSAAPLSSGRIGRPQKYPWDGFHLEVASLLLRHDLPEKKEAAIEYFQKWFQDKMGDLPGRTAIGDKLTPYYHHFGSNPEFTA